MSDCAVVRIRSLPDGAFQDAKEVGWEGNILHLTIGDGHPTFSLGTLAEVESGAKLYLGEVRHCEGPRMEVVVEHSLDRARLAAIQEIWN